MAELKIRQLEKDQNGIILPFETSKGKYFVIQPGAPIGIQRWTEYERLKIVLGTGKSFSALIETIGNIEKLLGSDKPLADVRVEAILTLNSLRRGLVEMSKERYNQALYLATIFIYREGDDPLTWDFDRATEYIRDWAAEGLSEQDFFAFALSTVNGFREQLSKIQAEIRREEARLSGIGSPMGQGEKVQ